MSDEALDLSKSSCEPVGSSPPPTPSTPSSPYPSVSSDCEGMRGLHPIIDRSSSISSDGHESDGSMTTSVKAVLGSLPSGHLSPRQDSSVDGADRPFKAYPLDPSNPLAGMNSMLGLSAAAGIPGMPYGMPPSALYGDSHIISTPLMSYLAQRKRKQENREHGEPKKAALRTIPEDKKDIAYWERRRKNNEAAKRSRDTRRHKEEEIAMRAAFLEQENLKLRAQVAILKNETAKLHYMLYNRS